MKPYLYLFMVIGWMIFLPTTSQANEKNNETFVLKNIPAGTDITPYILAIENSQFECYRYKTDRRIFQFENGIILELFSAEEIKNNSGFSSNCYLEDKTPVSTSILTLGLNHTIIMVMETNEKSQPKTH